MTSDKPRSDQPGPDSSGDRSTNEGPFTAPDHAATAASKDPGSDVTQVHGGASTSGHISRADSNPRLWVGRRLGRYELTEFLGAGGMGVVYRSRDPIIERDVAIKILPKEVSANPVNLKRFLAEAKAAGKLSHPNVVSIYQVAEEGETYYLVMEYMAGGSIVEQLERGPLPVLEATKAMADACRGLAAAHALGMIHRDIKPANLLCTADGTVKVADFGLAKCVVETSQQITQAGQVVGTPYFMSPEQCESRPLDHRSDIYSLGATYYSLLTGTNPYHDAASTVQVMFAHCHGEVLDPRKVNPKLPEACSRIVRRAAAKQPAERYQSAEEMLADLEAVIAALSGYTHIPLPSESGQHPAKSPSSSNPVLAPTIAEPVLPSSSANWNATTVTQANSGVTPAATPPLPPAAAAGAEDAGRGARWPWIAGSVSACFAAALLYLVFGNRPSGDNVSAPAPTGEPIKIGILHSLTGNMANSESAVVDAALLRRTDRELSLRPRLADPATRRRLGRLGSFTLLADAMVFVGARMDTVLIAALRNAAAAAPYAAALKLQSALQALALPFVNLLMPMVSELWARGEAAEVARRLALTTRVAMQVTMPVALGLALFSEDIVGLWLGEDAVATTATIVVLLVATQVVTLTALPAEKALIGVGRVGVIGALAVVEGVVNVVLTIVLVSAHGAVGAAVATLVAYGVLAPARLPLAARAIGMRLGDLVRRGLVPALTSSLPPAAAMVAMLLVLPAGGVRGVAGLVVGAGIAAAIGLAQVGPGELRRTLSGAGRRAGEPDPYPAEA